MSLLPKFTEHEGHEKRHLPLMASSEPEDGIVGPWVLRTVPPGSRVLDLGCARGGVVAWLCEHGYEGYGAEIDADYVTNGAAYFASHNLSVDRIRLITSERLPFEDGVFDAVISNNVLEHISDLDGLALEISRICRPGAVSLHTYPPRLGVYEGHMRMPLVHWLPKGPLRRAAVRAALSIGVAAPYFTEHSIADRAAIFSTFSEEETYYWSRRQTRMAFTRAGMDVDFTRVARDHARTKSLPDNPAVISVAGWWFAAFRHTPLLTVKYD